MLNYSFKEWIPMALLIFILEAKVVAKTTEEILTLFVEEHVHTNSELLCKQAWTKTKVKQTNNESARVLL